MNMNSGDQDLLTGGASAGGGGGRCGGVLLLLDHRQVDVLVDWPPWHRPEAERAHDLHEAPVDAQHAEHLHLLRREEGVAVGDDEVGGVEHALAEGLGVERADGDVASSRP